MKTEGERSGQLPKHRFLIGESTMSDHNTEKSTISQMGSGITEKIRSSRIGGQHTLQDLLNKRGGSSHTQDGNQQLKKLKRQELLEILVNQSREIDRLKRDLKEAQERLADREIKIAEAGNLAEASLQIHHIFETAQQAADLYLDNVRRIAGVREETEGDEDNGDDR